MSIDGKKIILTGGSGGIGSRVARELLDLGADLLIVDRTAPQGLPARFLPADLGTGPGIDAAARRVAAEAPDILINLAGVQHFGPFENERPDHVELGYMVNLVAPVKLCQAVLPEMRRRRSGQIVNIGSVLGAIGYPYFVTYCSSKAGLHGFSESLRREVMGDGITVTHISPRAVRTGLSAGLVESFAALTGMTLDSPDVAVRRIVEAIGRRERTLMIGGPERIFARLNALAPLLLDGPIARGAARARHIFTNS